MKFDVSYYKIKFSSDLLHLDFCLLELVLIKMLLHLFFILYIRHYLMLFM